MEVTEPNERLKSLSEFYARYTQENIEKLKPLFETFCKNPDYSNLVSFDTLFEDVKRFLAVRDTLKVHTQPLNLKD